jgi:hypothetical protein
MNPVKCRRSRCFLPASKDRDDGLCWRCRSRQKCGEKRIAERAARKVKPKLGRPAGPTRPCVRCHEETLVKRLMREVCGTCRNLSNRLEQTAVRAAKLKAEDSPLCSVAGCRRPRETGRTCYEHVVQFDHPPKAPRPRAEDYAIQTRCMMEESDG